MLKLEFCVAIDGPLGLESWAQERSPLEPHQCSIRESKPHYTKHVCETPLPEASQPIQFIVQCRISAVWGAMPIANLKYTLKVDSEAW